MMYLSLKVVLNIKLYWISSRSSLFAKLLVKGFPVYKLLNLYAYMIWKLPRKQLNQSSVRSYSCMYVVNYISIKSLPQQHQVLKAQQALPNNTSPAVSTASPCPNNSSCKHSIPLNPSPVIVVASTARNIHVFKTGLYPQWHLSCGNQRPKQLNQVNASLLQPGQVSPPNTPFWCNQNRI